MKRQSVPISRLLEPGGHNADRRLSPRYSVVNPQALLAWKVEAENCETPARLLDISNGGVLALVEKNPVRGEPIWLRLGEPTPTEWAEGWVVGTTKIPGLLWFRRASYLVRMRFLDPCPYDLFKLATHGDQLDAAQPESFLPEHDRRYWR